MKNTSDRPAESIENIVDLYGNMLFRLCLLTLGNAADAEDAVQETMIRYLQKAPAFENGEHEKAWLITVATNKCKDILRFRSRHPVVEDMDLEAYAESAEDSGIMDALRLLPEKYRVVLILYYVEEYSVKDIAKMIGRTSSAVKMRLPVFRILLQERLQSICRRQS